MIYFLRYETSYGPFFSSKGKAKEYLEEIDYTPEEVEQVLENTHPYISLVKVEVDNTEQRYRFDG